MKVAGMKFSPTEYQIVAAVGSGADESEKLYKLVPATRATIRSTLFKLRSDGYVKSERVGKTATYALTKWGRAVLKKQRAEYVKMAAFLKSPVKKVVRRKGKASK